jgi:SAM-dependent methyltransferase
MSFSDAAAYDAFMGRYSGPLAPQFADLADISSGQRALDVGCGTGMLTGELIRRLGVESVTVSDPSAAFTATIAELFPGVDVSRAPAEELPFGEASFDATLAQLVVHFMTDPVAGLTEMRRVTKPGGVVAACVWDHAGGQGPLAAFWRAARLLDPTVADESSLTGARRGHLAELMASAGLDEIVERTLVVDVDHPTFEEWWEPFTRGVGPAGAFVGGLSGDARAELREICHGEVGDGPFTVHAAAWAVRGRA